MILTGSAIAFLLLLLLLHSIACSSGEDGVALVPPGDEDALTPPRDEGARMRELYGTGRGRTIEDGGYDCASSRTLANPCDDADGCDLVPLPGCRKYALCRDGGLVHTFDCPGGEAFDQRMKTCIGEELAYCPCRRVITSSSSSDDEDDAIDGGGGMTNPSSSRSWFDVRGDVTEYIWITDGGYRTPSSNGVDVQYQYGTRTKSGKSIDYYKMSKGGKMAEEVDDAPWRSGKATNGIVDVVARSSKGGKKANAIARAPKGGKSSKSERGVPLVLTSSWDTILPPPTSLPTSGPSAPNTIGVNTYPPSAVIPSYSPTMALPSATTKPTATKTNGPITYPPSEMLLGNSPTIASALATTEPTATKTNGPITSPPSAMPLSNSPTIALLLGTTEPSATKTVRPNTKPPPALPSSDSPTIFSSSTATPSQESSRESCMSGSGSETFDGGVFPVLPWTTGGDGNWTIHEGITWRGKHSIKSPNLTVAGATSIAVANASVSTCPTFSGGIVSISVLAGGILPPTDVFGIYVDGVEMRQLIDLSKIKALTSKAKLIWKSLYIPLDEH
ncbi:hypothetical protein ACHAXA_007420 [Cyclostephanos tholiformis]|uniref:Chitin-binding type-2 domain-containing protein n=1 Tax=Cyclostephanos tholiformis TaxID=382380 RepID=A0ABD3SD16_9STRA